MKINYLGLRKYSQEQRRMLSKIILVFLLLSLSALTSQANVEDIISSVEIIEANTEKKLLLNKDKNELYIFSNYKLFIIDTETNKLKSIIGIPVIVDSFQVDKSSEKIYALGKDKQSTTKLVEINTNNNQLNVLSISDYLYSSRFSLCEGSSIVLNGRSPKIIGLSNGFEEDEKIISIPKISSVLFTSAVNNKSQSFIIYTPSTFSAYNLFLVDCKEGNVKRKNRLRFFPSYIVIDEKRNMVSFASNSTIYNLDGDTLKTISSGSLTGSGSIIKSVLNEKDKLLYILRSSSVEIYDTTTNKSISNINIGSGFLNLTNIEIDEVLNRAFITSQYSKSIAVIDLNQKKVIDYIFLDKDYTSEITINKDTHKLFISSLTSNKLFSIDYGTTSNSNPFFYQRFNQISEELSNLNPAIADDAPEYSDYVNKYITYLNNLAGSKCASNINKKPSFTNGQSVGSIEVTIQSIRFTSQESFNSYYKIINLISLAEEILGIDLNKNNISEICEF